MAVFAAGGADELSLYEPSGECVVDRKVSIEPNGALEPWGMPERFSVTRPDQGTVTCPQCGTIVVRVVQEGRYFVNVHDPSVVYTEAVYRISPLRIARLAEVIHLSDDLHEVKQK